MFTQILIGAAIISMTIAIHASMLGTASMTFHTRLDRVSVNYTRKRAIYFVLALVMWLLLAHLLEIGVWAMALWLISALPTLDDAVYFALVSNTALGYGDIILGHDWRITGAMSSASGLLLFGWSTAYMVGFMDRPRDNRADRVE